MYKMFINNVQIGNYTTLKKLTHSLVFLHYEPKSAEWKGNSLFIKTF